MFDCSAFLARIRKYPSDSYRLLAPAKFETIKAVEDRLGKLPQSIAEFVNCVDGGELFILGCPLVTFFRLSGDPPLPVAEWPPDWYIDRFTARWRAESIARQNQWAIAMTSYGALALLDEDEAVDQWDTTEQRWISGKIPFAEWIEQLFADGDRIIADR